MFRRWWYRRLQRALLFSFWDGQKVRRVDGERLWRALRANKTLTDPLIEAAVQRDDPAAVETYLAAAAELFGVERYDPQTGRGLTDAELAQLLVRFAEWVAQKKTTPVSSPTPSPTTESPP